jgi:hypothetical protein
LLRTPTSDFRYLPLIRNFSSNNFAKFVFLIYFHQNVELITNVLISDNLLIYKLYGYVHKAQTYHNTTTSTLYSLGFGT